MGSLFYVKLQQIESDFQVRESVKVTRHDYLNEDVESIVQEHSRLTVNITSLLKWKKKEVAIPLQICNLASTAPDRVTVQVCLIYICLTTCNIFEREKTVLCGFSECLLDLK